jgi:hypothetical protein
MPERICDRCGLTLLGRITHAAADECLYAMRGHYEGLKRRHRTVVRDRDSKAEGMERWRTRAKAAEEQLRRIEQADLPMATLLRLKRRVDDLERRTAA